MFCSEVQVGSSSPRSDPALIHQLSDICTICICRDTSAASGMPRLRNTQLQVQLTVQYATADIDPQHSEDQTSATWTVAQRLVSTDGEGCQIVCLDVAGLLSSLELQGSLGSGSATYRCSRHPHGTGALFDSKHLHPGVAVPYAPRRALLWLSTREHPLAS